MKNKKNLLIFWVGLILTLIVPITGAGQEFQADTLWMADTLPNATVVYKKRISLIDTIRGADTLILHRDIEVLKRDSVARVLKILIQKEAILTLIYDSVYVVSDTLILRQDTVFTRNEKILRSIHHFSQKNNFISRLIRSYYRYDINDIQQKSKPVKVTNQYMYFEDKIIRSIEVVVLDAMGYDIRDTAQKPKSILETAANAIHLKSHDWVIRNQLLFKVGDKVDPFQFSETERLLRQNRYIYDVRLQFKESKNKDSVDVKVIAQDVFSLGASVNGNWATKMLEVHSQDVNFFGTGQLLQYRFKYQSDLPGGANHYANYFVNNVHNSFISSNVYYNIENGRRTYGIGVNREFVTPSIKWIGGVNVDYYRFPYKKDLYIHPSFQSFPLTYNRQDYWLGLPTRLFISEKKQNAGKRVIFSGRYLHTDYTERPEIQDINDYPFLDSDFLLASLAVFSRRNYVDRYIFRYGRTEDIPEGSLFNWTGGLHSTIRAKRPYLAITYSISKFNQALGYLYTHFGLGGFMKGQTIEDGVLEYKSLYFTPMFELSGWKMRHFLGIRYILGHNMILGDRVYLANERGLRGFNNYSISGNQKFIINSESNFFLPLNVVGFRIAVVLFADLAWISFNEKIFSKDNFFPGYGVGLKIRNDHLVFDAIQILFGFYPFADTIGLNKFLFFQRNYSFFTFNEFNLSRPNPIPYY